MLSIPSYKLWINHEFYIPVDAQGYCVSQYYEGALGIIIEIRRRNGGTYALKIPWLMADTPVENSYNSSILSGERDMVMKIFSDALNTEGLMPGEAFGAMVMQKTIQTCDAHPAAQAFHNANIAIQYRKGKSPRFCAIFPGRPSENGYAVFPETVTDCPLTDKKIFSRAYRKARYQQTNWERTVAVTPKNSPSFPGIYSLKESVAFKNCDNLWYLGVPAVVYAWGRMTLQEAISNGSLQNWELSDHLILLEKLIGGVYSLHRRGFLHTDIRPANVMARGVSEDPENYVFIDYAGYNIDSESAERSSPKGGKATPFQLGPSIGGERISSFYAPERHKGIEKEEADTAVILKKNNQYIIMFGWRRLLLDTESGKLKEGIRKDLLTLSFSADGCANVQERLPENDVLLSGDRLQIREYLFDIQAVGELNSEHCQAKVYKCNSIFWKIFHGRIVVRWDQEFTADWMAIPRIIELRQWSEATDCYGIGALFLYNLFRMKGDRSPSSRVTEDIAFQRLLEEVSNPHFLNLVWFELSRICTQLTICYQQLRRQEDLHRIAFSPENYRDQSENIFYSKEKSIAEYAKYICNVLIHASPGLLVLLKHLHYNYIHFLYTIYFILCCLHRRSNMAPHLLIPYPETPNDTAGAKIEYPFCLSRVTQKEQVKRIQPVQRMKCFSNTIRKIVEANYFKNFILNPDELKDPENIPAPLLRWRLNRLEESYEQLIQDHSTLEKELVLAKEQERLTDLQDQDLKESLLSLHRFAGQMEKNIFYKNRQVEALIQDLTELSLRYNPS